MEDESRLGDDGGTCALEMVAAPVDGIAVKSRACMEERAKAAKEEAKGFFISTKPHHKGIKL
jgi:hypothetical protein